MKTPFFTVVVPLFNKAAHISATMASIAAQTFANYEVIVVDDGSTDDGAARVAAAGGAARLIRQVNAGPGAARNRAIDAAVGEWVAFLDADDLWQPEHLATLADVIAACPDADVVATGFDRGETLVRCPQADGSGPSYIDFYSDYRLVWTSATAVRAVTLRQERFGIAWPGEDVDLWVRLALRHRFAAHPARTVVYVQRTGGAMDSQASAGAAVPIDRQPLFVTIARILADPILADQHQAVTALRNALMLDYVRPALFNGQTALARSYLMELRNGGGRRPWLYRWLARLPAPLAVAGSRAYGAIRRRLARRRR